MGALSLMLESSSWWRVFHIAGRCFTTAYQMCSSIMHLIKCTFSLAPHFCVFKIVHLLTDYWIGQNKWWNNTHIHDSFHFNEPKHRYTYILVLSCAHRSDFPPLRLALVDLYKPLRAEGRALRSGALDSAAYPVQLQEIHGKLVTAHPNGFMTQPWFAMPYKNVGFDLSEEEMELMQRAESAD